jgi:hypothetical protein
VLSSEEGAMTVPIQQIQRAQKRAIALALYANLSARFRRGPPEVALDDFLPQLQDVATRLNATRQGSPLDREQRILAIVSADDEVDTYLRHIEGYLAVEALRRTGANKAKAKALHDLAFPDGLAHIDDRIVEENFHCRASLTILRAPEHSATLKALELPPVWLDRWEAALDASDSAQSQALRASAIEAAGGSAAEAATQDPEADWVDLVARLRRHVTGRAARDDAARIEEGRVLLRPLFDALQALRVSDEAARPPRRV